MSWIRTAKIAHVRWTIILLAACVAAALIALAWLEIANRHEEQVAEAAGRAQQLATAIGNDLDRSFASTAVAVGVVADRLMEPGSEILRHTPALVWFLHSIQARQPEVHGLGVIGADGVVRVETAPGAAAREPVAHRRYFTINRDRSDAGLVVEGPIAVSGGEEIVVVAHRLVDRDGAFTGIVRAAVTSGSLREILERAIGTAPATAAMLLRDDGTVIVRSGSAGAVGLPPLPREHPLRRAMDDAPSGQLAAVDLDGTDRLAAFYRLRSQPFAVVVGIDRGTLLAGSRRETALEVLAVLIGVLAVSGAAWWLIRAFGEAARLAQRLAASERRFREFANASSDWLFETDTELRFTYVSERVRAISGYDPAVIVGRRREDVADASFDPKGWQRYLDAVAQRRPYRDVVYATRGADGRTLYYQISAVPRFDRAGRFLGYRGVGSDVTARVEAERMQRSLESQVRQKQRLESLGTLAGGIAHDFNNALVPILALAQTWAKRAEADSRLQQDMTRIVGAARHSRDIVRKILAFSRSEEPALEPIDLGTCVAEAVSLARLGVPPEVTLAEAYDGKLLVCADRSQIVQIVTNTVANAVHAISGGGRIAVAVGLAGERERAAHGLPAGGPFALLRIADSGCGMEAATVARIFEPYFTTKPVGVGTGLGLAVVHGIVTRHGGQIRVDSAPGAGTTFTIYLPLTEEAQRAA